jgi:hypothetical protein
LALSLFLHDGEGLVKPQHLSGVRIALRQLCRAFSTQRPRVGRLGYRGFQDTREIPRP